MENQKVLANINLIKETINKALVESIDSKLKKSIEIIAISKKQPLERLVAALNANHKIFGENKVQEAVNKWPVLKKKYHNIFCIHIISKVP